MRDEEDGLALARKLLHRGHELVDLLRGEHGGRLVEDENLVVAVEHLENLDALLHADGDVLDLGIEVNLQAVFFRELLDLFARFLALNEAELRRLRAEDDVVEHGEHVDELEVLVHHADAERGGIIGVVDLDGLAVFADLARLRLVQAEEHAHERGFAGAVFTEQGVDLALFELQGDVVVGLDARELLGDVKHFDHIRRSVVHTATYFPISVSVFAYRQPPDGKPRCPSCEMALLIF